VNAKPFKYIFLVIAVVVLAPPAHADWINFSGAENARNIAEIHINDNHVRVLLEIYVGDFEKFEELIPDDFFSKPDSNRPSARERLQNFSERTFQIKAENGENLRARLELVEPRMRKERPSPFAGMINPYTRQRIPGPPEDKRVLYAELVYPFKKRPKTLTIIPPIDSRGMSTASIGFIIYHQRVPIIDFRYLSEVATLMLDWEDPWYSSFDKKALKRWQKGGVMSFLYIEPYEVRHEVLARVKDLDEWMDLGLRGDEFIEADENEPLKKRVREFFLKRDKVLIDGKQLRPILDRTAFVKYAMTGSTFLEQPERLPINTAMVGVIITYITDGIPQEVSMEWNLWSNRIQKVPTNAIDPAGPFPSYITPDDNVHVWKNFLKTYTFPTVEHVAVAASVTNFGLPLGNLIALLLVIPLAWQIRKRRQNKKPILFQAGLIVLFIAASAFLYPYLQVSVTKPGSIASGISSEQAKSILHSLLKNVYRAFDFREEEDVYDKLAISASGDLLADIYLQNRKSFKVKRAGGAVAKVKEIEVMDVQTENNPENSQALDIRSKWTAMGTVGHWGHIHTRQNQYEAIVTVQPIDGSWKITGLELLEEKRIEPSAQKAKTNTDQSLSKTKVNN
jgi:hypothetical protein